MRTRTNIEFRNLTKNFGAVHAVSDVSFTVEPGRVTGFLGPNGAGKTTSLRMLLGLVRPTSGTATFGGIEYRNLERPLATVGTALEASSFNPGRTARNHLAVYAIAAGIARKRVGEVLELTGIAEAADRRVGGYSLGMRQRLGLAFALLGDPEVLVLDEPINGLDPEGIRWIRGLLQQLAAEGRTVLVSSHLLSEVQQTVERVVIVSHGRIVYEGTLDALESAATAIVDAPDRDALRTALEAAQLVVTETDAGLVVSAASADIGAIAQRAGVPLSLLHAQRAGLEDVFLQLVGPGTGVGA
ncbi:MAG: ABC transporter ATP-binding protein [Salinibacterium sp.]|nr:ABC transporter ATP-binding protein [Salinibacterium sp.]